MTFFDATVRPYSAFVYGHSFVTSTAVNGTPGLIMWPYKTQWRNWGLAGSTTTQQVNEARISEKVYPYAGLAPTSIFILISGINDYIVGASAATVVFNTAAICTKARNAGYDYTIISTAPYSSDLTAGEDAQRLLGNSTLLPAAGGGVIDYVVDLASNAALAANIASGDGTHPANEAGRQMIADMHYPYLDEIMISGV